jgi:hypothetical protein
MSTITTRKGSMMSRASVCTEERGRWKKPKPVRGISKFLGSGDGTNDVGAEGVVDGHADRHAVRVVPDSSFRDSFARRFLDEHGIGAHLNSDVPSKGSRKWRARSSAVSWIGLGRIAGSVHDAPQTHHHLARAARTHGFGRVRASGSRRTD